MHDVTVYAGAVFLVVALIGSAYTFASGFAVRWFLARTSAPDAEWPAITILKPLHGDEPNLAACLEGFFDQDYPAPIQIIFGVCDESDPAVAICRDLALRHSTADMQIVIDDRRHGANRKISNLMNMERYGRHPVLVVADSDVEVGRDYLRRLSAALAVPGVGLVSCAYLGVPTGNLWSRLAAMAISYHFLPSVALGLRLKLAKPCFGPTMAFRKTVLDEAGGFARFVDRLADDFEIGRAIRELGYAFAVPSLVVGHGCPERTARQLLGHELRWARTIRLIDPKAYVGSLLCHPVLPALFAMALLRAAPAALATLALVAASRVFVVAQVDAAAGVPAGPLWLAPIRDLLSSAIHVWAMIGSTVVWRGHRFRIGVDGALLTCNQRLLGSGSSRPAGAPFPSSRSIL